MTKVAVMQPYLFPYLGYFQLINAVDDYVFLDDVNWMKKGWINRNTLSDDFVFTIPVKKASQNKLIKDVQITHGWAEKLCQTIKHKYSNAPNYNKHKNFVEFLIKNCEGSKFIDASCFIIEEISSLLELKTRFHQSSDFDVGHLKSSNKIKSICEDFNADMYINPIGGKNMSMYEPKLFEPIKLRFINNLFTVKRTSIIDLLFTNDLDVLKDQLHIFELLEK